MQVRVLIGLALALACAIGASLSGLWKQKGAVQTADVDIRRPIESAVALFRSKWFLIGWIGAAIAWLLHVGALALAPLSLGQAVISGGIVLLGLLAERFFDFKLTRRQWAGLVLMGLAMAVLAATAHSESNHTSYQMLEIAGFELGAVGVGIGCVVICRLERLGRHKGVILGSFARRRRTNWTLSRTSAHRVRSRRGVGPGRLRSPGCRGRILSPRATGPLASERLVSWH
jgi:drug/metabolite transporter (DMT)-like permease